MERETLAYDVVIVGAGPAGLSTAIQLKTLSKKHGSSLNVCVLEKGDTVGAHILSGAVIETPVLDQLIPNWRSLTPPITCSVQRDRFALLTQKKRWPLPLPKRLRNTGNYIVSLGLVCRWLAEIATSMDVDIFTGFSASSLIIDNECVQGVQTGDMGRGRDGTPQADYQPGVNIRATYTVLAEGCRGHLTQHVERHFQLRDNAHHQTYAIGVKELWEVDNEYHQAGTVEHTVGWPLAHATYGGSFIYHREANKLAIGLVIGLDYDDAFTDPHQALQQFKTHPAISPLLQHGRCIAYGARALNEGGYQAMSQSVFPGGLIVGCAMGYVNVPKIKGTHNALHSGLIAGQSIYNAFLHDEPPKQLWQHQTAIMQSDITQELYWARNIRPSFQWGLMAGLIYSGLDLFFFRGKAPWTFSHRIDHTQLREQRKPVTTQTLRYDGKLTFDKLTAVSLSQVAHNEDQPCHLVLKDPKIPLTTNYPLYAGPEQYYCPAGVYEYLEDANGKMTLQINGQNCIHCKTCDIKDPTQNIQWLPPEGGGGPNYHEM